MYLQPKCVEHTVANTFVSMEVLRKRSHYLCECHNIDSVPGNGIDSFIAHHQHKDFHNNVDMMMNHDAASDHIFGLQQKRKCNGVSTYSSQADHAKDHGALPDKRSPPLVASMGNETVAMATDTVAVSYRPHIPGNSIHSSCHTPMDCGGDATNTSISRRPQNQVRGVCQRCLSGEPGHITHILS